MNSNSNPFLADPEPTPTRDYPRCRVCGWIAADPAADGRCDVCLFYDRQPLPAPTRDRAWLRAADAAEIAVYRVARTARAWLNQAVRHAR